MVEGLGSVDRPIRVVVFGGGPVLERGIKRFLCRLESHSDIDLLAVFCQSRSQSRWAVAGDLWRRRRFLAIPLLAAQVATQAGRLLTDFRVEAQVDRTVASLGSRIHFVPDIHAQEVLDAVRTLAPDLGLVYGAPILKPSLFEIPEWGTLGIHHGKVPEYRGKKTAFWAMYNGEKAAGVTIQRIGAGLDTGNIVNCGEVPTGRRSLRAVWNDLEELGLDLYVDSILAVRGGRATCVAQNGRGGELYRDPRPVHLIRFWWRQMWRDRVLL